MIALLQESTTAWKDAGALALRVEATEQREVEDGEALGRRGVVDAEGAARVALVQQRETGARLRADLQNRELDMQNRALRERAAGDREASAALLAEAGELQVRVRFGELAQRLHAAEYDARLEEMYRQQELALDLGLQHLYGIMYASSLAMKEVGETVVGVELAELWQLLESEMLQRVAVANAEAQARLLLAGQQATGRSEDYNTLCMELGLIHDLYLQKLEEVCLSATSTTKALASIPSSGPLYRRGHLPHACLFGWGGIWLRGRLRPGDPAPSGPLGHVRSRAHGAHAHGNTERQAMDGLRTEVCGQQKQSNNPHNNQHILNTPIIGRR